MRTGPTVHTAPAVAVETEHAQAEVLRKPVSNEPRIHSHCADRTFAPVDTNCTAMLSPVVVAVVNRQKLIRCFSAAFARRSVGVEHLALLYSGLAHRALSFLQYFSCFAGIHHGIFAITAPLQRDSSCHRKSRLTPCLFFGCDFVFVGLVVLLGVLALGLLPNLITFLIGLSFLANVYRRQSDLSTSTFGVLRVYLQPLSVACIDLFDGSWNRASFPESVQCHISGMSIHNLIRNHTLVTNTTQGRYACGQR